MNMNKFLHSTAPFGIRSLFEPFGVLALVATTFFAGQSPAHGEGTEAFVLEEIEFREARLQDAIRAISEVSGINIISTGEAGNKLIAIYLRNQTVPEIVDSICRVSGLWYRHNEETGAYVVMTTKEYQQDIVVFRDESTRMFQLGYLNVGIAARTIYDLFGERVQWYGQANQHLGNDYEVGATMNQFEENYDMADGSGSSSGSSSSSRSGYSRSSNRSSSGRSGSSRYGGSNYLNQEPIRSTDLDLSPERIKRLEGLTGQQAPMVEEGAISQVSRNRAPPIYITVNRLHNLLFIRTADDKAMEEISTIVEDSDRPVPEVLLEMKVLAVSLNDQFDSAFDINYIDSGKLQTGPDDGLDINPLNALAAEAGSPLLGVGTGSVVKNSAMVFQGLSDDLRVRIQLLAQDNNLKTLATPMLMAANNQPASLFIGEEAVLTVGYNASTVSSGDTGTGNVINNQILEPETQVREIGNKLTILPSINADRSVVMRLLHENSTVKEDGGRISLVVGTEVQEVAIDTVDTSTLEGTVLAQDGKTIAVGGMMRTTFVDSEQKVPILGNIPFLGMLFKSKSKKESKTELVLMITPHVLSAPEDGEAVSQRRLNELMSDPTDLNLKSKKFSQNNEIKHEEKIILEPANP